MARQHKTETRFEETCGINVNMTKSLIEASKAKFYAVVTSVANIAGDGAEVWVINTSRYGLRPHDEVICVPPLCSHSEIKTMVEGTIQFHPYETYPRSKFVEDLQLFLGYCKTYGKLESNTGVIARTAVDAYGSKNHEYFAAKVSGNIVWDMLFFCAKEYHEASGLPYTTASLTDAVVKVVNQHWQTGFGTPSRKLVDTLTNLLIDESPYLDPDEPEANEYTVDTAGVLFNPSGGARVSMATMYNEHAELAQAINNVVDNVKLYLATFPAVGKVLTIRGSSLQAQAQPSDSFQVKLL